MAYSDKDLQMATQIAYMDLDKAYIDAYGGDITLKELLNRTPVYKTDLEEKLKNAADDISRAQVQGKLDVYNLIMEEGSKYGEWKIKNVRDDNVDTGLYACLIETGDREAIVGFRGSEDMKNPTQLKNDWIDADLGLLNSTETRQQESVEKYMSDLYKQYGDAYDSFSLTGHSLGGSDAFHGALTAPEGMKNKITQVISFDGPGASNEYILAHYTEIAKMAPKMRHYAWSLIGGMLNELPFLERKNVRIKDAPEGEGGKYFFYRHDTCFVEFSDNGYIIESPVDPLVEGLSELTQTIDMVTTQVGVIGTLEFIGIMLLPIKNSVIPAVTVSVIEKLCINISNWFVRSFLDAGRSASYDVILPVLEQTVQEENVVARELGYIQDEVAKVKGSLQGGIMMWGAKYKLGRIADHIESYYKKMGKLAGGVASVASQYEQAENRIVAHTVSK